MKNTSKILKRLIIVTLYIVTIPLLPLAVLGLSLTDDFDSSSYFKAIADGAFIFLFMITSPIWIIVGLLGWILTGHFLFGLFD